MITPEAMERAPLVLVADDDPISRKLLDALAARCGWQTRMAVDGAAALALWQSGNFDLVLLDMEMPMLSGLEVVSRIRAEEAARGLAPVPVIALTAHPRDEVLERCLQAGVDDCLSKPFHLEDFALICRKAIDRSAGKGYKQ